jgi:hypothetical protein
MNINEIFFLAWGGWGATVRTPCCGPLTTYLGGIITLSDAIIKASERRSRMVSSGVSPQLFVHLVVVL